MTKSMKTKMIAGLCAAMVMTAGFAFSQSAIEASAENDCMIVMRTGASVRISEEESGTGIRFTADIPNNLVTETTVGDTVEYTVNYSGDIKEVGMIIVPSFALEGYTSGDAFEYLYQNYQKEKKDVSAVCNKAYKDENADTYYVAGAIVDIIEANLAETYQAIPYTWDGENYIFGAKSDARTIHYVFQQALDDTTMETTKRAKLLNKVVEMQKQLDLEELFISNFDGYDLSKFTVPGDTDWTIESAGVGANVATPDENGKLASLALPWQATAEDVQDFTITYSNTETLTLKAKVWMKKISTFDDLLMFDHSSGKMTNTTNNANYGSALLEIGGGYFGLTNDIVCDITKTVYVRWMSASEALVFDGNGYTISNFWGNLMHDAKGTFKDINFVNAKARDCRGLLGLQLIGGTKVENVNISVTLENYASSSAICTQPYGGTVTLDNVNVVVKNGYASNADYANGARQGIIAGRVLQGAKGKFALNNCTFVSDNVDGSLPLLGISPETAYINASETASTEYTECISGTYKNYGYYELGKAAFDAMQAGNSTESFQTFVADNQLTTAWGPLGVTLTAVNDTAGLKAMVGKTTGYYYLTNDISFDASVWSGVTRKQADAKTVVEGNGFAIDGLTAHLYENYNGRLQNIAFININGALSSIAYAISDTTVLDNVFFHGAVKDVASGDQTAGLIVQVSAPVFTAKDVVVWTTNTVVSSSYYRGAVTGLTRKESRMNGENLVIISAMKPGCPYLGGDQTQKNWMTTEEMMGTDETKPYGGYLQGDYYYYADTATFDSDYTGELSAQNQAYYNKLVAANA